MFNLGNNTMQRPGYEEVKNALKNCLCGGGGSQVRKQEGGLGGTAISTTICWRAITGTEAAA